MLQMWQGRRRIIKEKWTFENGPSVEVPRCLDVSIEDPRNPDGKIICENCYQENRLATYNENELLEINTQFGLEYIRAGQLEKAESAFRKAIGTKITANGLAHLAYCLNELAKVRMPENYTSWLWILMRIILWQAVIWPACKSRKGRKGL